MYSHTHPYERSGVGEQPQYSPMPSTSAPRVNNHHQVFNTITSTTSSPPTYFHHQRQDSFGQAAVAAAAAAAASGDISPPPAMVGRAIPFHHNNGGNRHHSGWFNTTTTDSLDSSTTTSSSFGQSPPMLNNNNGRDLIIVSPSTSTSHGDGLNGDNNDDNVNKQRNLQEMFEKRRRRRESHNAVERRRRETINDRIQELYALLSVRIIETETTNNAPSTFQEQQQHQSSIRNVNKGTVLKLSVDHIRELQIEVTHYQERIRYLEQVLCDIRQCQQRGVQYNFDQVKQPQQEYLTSHPPRPSYNPPPGSSSLAISSTKSIAEPALSPQQQQHVGLNNYPDHLHQRSSLQFHPLQQQ